MGAEATCTLRLGKERREGTVQLETDELIFRATSGTRTRFKYSEMSDVRAKGGDLLFETSAGPVSLSLGAKAERWAQQIKSPKGLIDKLDLKPHYWVGVVGGKDASFLAQLAERVTAVKTGRVPKNANVVFLWADTPAALGKLASLERTIARDGAIWVIHPKGKTTPVKDTDVYAAGKKVGLTATKVARFSDTHTAEKLVIPVARR